MALALEYNSKRERLIIPEYGRHIQNLIQFATTIEDKDERQAFTAYVVKLMEQVNPNTDTGDDLKEKLWKHAVVISDYKLDVTMPSGKPIEKEDAFKRPAALEYPQKNPRQRHYGANILSMIEKAGAMEDEEKRLEFAKVIGSYMKMAYQNWHKEHYASDEMIKEDLKRLSKGKLELEDDDSLDYLKHARNSGSHKGRSRKKGGRRRSGRSRKRR